MELHQLAERAEKMLEYFANEYVVEKAMPVEDIEYAPAGLVFPDDALSGGPVPSPVERAKTAEWKKFENGSEWGNTPETDWCDFRFTLTVPEGIKGKYVLSIRTGREGQWEAVNPQFACYVNGTLTQAFDTRHTRLVLDEHPVPGTKYEFVIGGYANCDLPSYNHAKGILHFPVFYAEAQDVFDEMEQLIYDIRMPLEAARLLPPESRDRDQTLYAISEALNLVDIRVPFTDSYRASVVAAREYLKEHLYAPLALRPAEAHADVIGHTHIDVAWLWDLYQTRHKAVRSFATMMKLLDDYPEYRFMSSQAQLYEFVRQDAPELFARIQQAVKEGRWQPEGGMWVEADCNLSSGEALVRQFLYGNEFFEKYFDKRQRILWLPDVFGYSAALPQILKKSGIDYFFTSKLSWSEFNLYPYDTFSWRGIDGTEVLTHFTPSRSYNDGNFIGLSHFTTYNADITPDQMKGGWKRFQQKGLDDHFYVSYGFGDGGGGPTEEMVENARRLATPMPGVPAVEHVLPDDFFDKLAERVGGDKHLPKWQGELYLEYHRGTYTSIAKNKRNNRKTELLARDAEAWLECARVYAGAVYPNDELRDIWREILTLQFHDILPGSSIKKVYDDSDIIYASLQQKLSALKEGAIKALTEKGACALAAEDGILAFNSLGTVRDDVITFTCADKTVTHLEDSDGTLFPVQFTGKENEACAFVTGLAPLAATGFIFRSLDKESADDLIVSTNSIDTPFYTGTFDAAMRFTSLVDKRCDRELAREGMPLNSLVVYENRPHAHDAWDIAIYYNEHKWDVDNVVSTRVTACGPVYAAIETEYKWSRSTIRQTMRFYRDMPRIDFDTTVDWQDVHYLLKAHFPVDVFHTEATYDIQFGNLTRPTHRNTSWDVARFEVCAHKWMDLSEGNYGVSLLNDCKYGHSADENGMALTLLKSATVPNPEADIGLHVFTYSLLPHLGDWRVGDTPGEAYQLNIPVTCVPGKGSVPSAFASDSPNVVVETVKRALGRDETVVRLYECYGERTDVTLTTGLPVKECRLLSLMEDDLGPVEFKNGTIHLTVKPYEIITLALK